MNLFQRLHLAAAALLLLLSGCSGVPVDGSSAVTELAPDKAVVILSVSHDRAAGAGANAIFYMDESSYPGRAIVSSVSNLPDTPVSSAFTDRFGQLYFLQVGPGKHQFDGWQVASAGARIFPKAAMPPLEFEVRAGEAIYLGNLHAKLALGHRMLFGMQSAIGAIPTVVDRSQEDVALAVARSPLLAGKIQVRLLQLGVWSADGESVRHLDPLPLPMPIPKK